MFKVVREFVDIPLFLLVCDNRNCAAMARGEVSFVNEEETALYQRSFLTNATKDGWMIGLDAQLCPGHAKLHKEMVERGKERGKEVVTPASLQDTLAFGGGGGGRKQ